MSEYYEQFSDIQAMDYLHKTFENIYLPTKGHYADYPIKRNNKISGGVSENSALIQNEWYLSTDIGCAFMSID